MQDNHTPELIQQQEVWRDVPGFVGVYQVSSLGRVKSLRRLSKRGWMRERIMKPGMDRGGYLQLSIKPDGVRVTPKVHSWVASAFIGERPDGFEINHVDGDKTNNRPENLEYVTHQENMHHAKLNGLVRGRYSLPRITDEQICKLRRVGMNLQYISERVGLSRHLVKKKLSEHMLS